MHKLTITLILFITIAVSSFSQSINGYSFDQNLDSQMKRKIPANELMIDDSNQYLLVNYGNKPTYIVVYEIGTWNVIGNFRLRNWVDFSGTYYYKETNEIFIKEGRYSSAYYKLKLNTQKVEIVECKVTPYQCPNIEPKQSDMHLTTKDKKFKIIIDKKNKKHIMIYNQETKK